MRVVHLPSLVYRLKIRWKKIVAKQGKDTTTPFKSCAVYGVPGYLQEDNNIFRSNSRDEDWEYVSTAAGDAAGSTDWNEDKPCPCCG